ncbi:hypothetical protein [Sulfurimonas sp. CS5]|jgi:hypothetical protein|uniref:hypothetical protein n=1 Tax=Sulfurimonas sp. CS5 TaxID=3391145 RepID=UPI0039E97241
MKVILFLLLFAMLLNAFENKSSLSIKHINYDKFSDETIVKGNSKLKLHNDIFKADATVEYLYSNEYKERRYIILNELFVTKEYKDYSFTLGKIIKYWGELEGFNIADVYNQKNHLLDAFDNSAKLGSIGLHVTKYFDEDSLEFGVKFYEQDVKYSFISNYDKELSYSDERDTPTLHLMYSFATDKSFESETKLILLHGYDNKRYFIPKNQTTLSQYAYRVNKLLFLSNLIYKETILKCEASYTDVISDENMSNYAQLSFGLENNFYDILDIDIGFYLEYYSYLYAQDEKIKNVDISEIYNDDIFLALKLDLTDTRNSEIKGGILYDLKNTEKVFKVEAKSRVIDNLVVDAQYLQVLSEQNTLLYKLGYSTRVILGLTYTF